MKLVLYGGLHARAIYGRWPEGKNLVFERTEGLTWLFCSHLLPPAFNLFSIFRIPTGPSLDQGPEALGSTRTESWETVPVLQRLHSIIIPVFTEGEN